MTKTKLSWLALTATVLTGTAIAAETVTWNWGTADDEYASDPGFAESKAICKRLGPPIIPAADRPSPQEAQQLKDCDSEALYYGEKSAPDYVKARQCAILEAQNGSDEAFFSGNTILTEIYANGYGTARNLDLATALACSVEGAPAENDGRVLHLQNLAAKPGPFDFCDDITSGLAEGMCAARDGVKADYERDQKITAVAQGFPTAAQALFTAMKTAFDAFATAHAESETDLSGTGRGAFVIEAEAAERDQFLKDLTRLANGQWVSATPAEATAADAALNKSYQAAMKACAASDSNFSTVKPEDVRGAQRTWLTYRDAYVRFAQVAAPKITQSAILTRLTKLRTAELDNLPCKE